MVELRTKVCCNYACELLGVFQSFDNFYSDNSAGDGKETRCKKCRNLASNSRSYDYEANYVEDCSRVRLCNKCGEDRFYVLDFHHRNPEEKEMNLGDVRRLGWSKERILKEVAKCDVYCANCHRELHYLERSRSIA